MPIVILNRDLARRFTDGETRLELAAHDATTVRAVIATLERSHPGIAKALSTGMAVAINGAIYQDALLQEIPGDAEVSFMPAIEGG